MRSDLVKCGERVDDLQNGLFVIQDPKKFCFGMDAVLLSGFARVKKGEVALDMGTGTGIIPILLSDRTDGEHFTGLEIQHECAEMADRSVRFNGLEDRVRIVEGDIKEAAGIFGAASFDVVTCNPPYMIGQHGLTNPHVPKAIARHEILCTFDATLTKYKLEPKRMQLVYPFIDKEPNMVLIEACKGGNSRIQVERPLVVYERPGVYTKDILELYRMV